MQRLLVDRCIFQVSTSLFDTMAVTASGDVIGCGENDEGQVRPDLPAQAFLPRPSRIEPVLVHRVTQARENLDCRERKRASLHFLALY